MGIDVPITMCMDMRVYVCVRSERACTHLRVHERVHSSACMHLLEQEHVHERVYTSCVRLRAFACVCGIELRGERIHMHMHIYVICT